MQHNKYKTYILASIISSSFCISLQANTKNYFEDSKRGWFWGEKQVEKKLNDLKEDEVKNLNQTVIPWSVIDLLHPDEIVNLETETKNISVMYPTQNNILEYKKLQKYISNKAMGFTDVSYLVSKQDSEISNWVSDTSMNSRLTISAKRTNLWEKQKELIDRHKKDMIILVATLPTCPYCKEQMPLLKDFEDEFGVEFKEVDISTNRGFAEQYQVEKTPDLFLLYRDKNNEPLLTRFGNGLHTIEDLKSGVLAGLYSFKKISKEYLEY